MEAAVALNVSSTCGRQIVAIRDLPAGARLIELTAPFASVPFSSSRCGGCGGASSALQKCSRCGAVRYCSTSCQRVEWSSHKRECSALASAVSAGRRFPDALRLAARVMLIADAKAGDASASSLATTKGPLTPARCAALDSAAGVQAMVAHPAEADTCATDSAMLGGLAMLLGAGGDPRVIQRLSVDGPTLLARLRANAFTLADAEGRAFGVGLFPRAACLNHSCAPNAVVQFSAAAAASSMGVVASVRTTERVKSGDEVTIAYVDVGQPGYLRRAAIRGAGYCFDCACPRCANADNTQFFLIETSPHPAPPSIHFPVTHDDEKMSGVACITAGCDGLPCVAVDPPAITPRRAYVSTCRKCGERAPASSATAALGALQAAAASSAELEKGDAQAALAAAAPALGVALRDLPATHWALGVVASAAAHAAVGTGAFDVAEAANAAGTTAIRSAHPRNHPSPALFAAQAGKLAHLKGNYARAVASFKDALRVLSVTLGNDAELVRDLELRLAQATAEEASA